MTTTTVDEDDVTPNTVALTVTPDLLPIVGVAGWRARTAPPYSRLHVSDGEIWIEFTDALRYTQRVHVVRGVARWGPWAETLHDFAPDMAVSKWLCQSGHLMEAAAPNAPEGHPVNADTVALIQMARRELDDASTVCEPAAPGRQARRGGPRRGSAIRGTRLVR